MSLSSSHHHVVVIISSSYRCLYHIIILSLPSHHHVVVIISSSCRCHHRIILPLSLSRRHRLVAIFLSPSSPRHLLITIVPLPSSHCHVLTLLSPYWLSPPSVPPLGQPCTVRRRHRRPSCLCLIMSWRVYQSFWVVFTHHSGCRSCYTAVVADDYASHPCCGYSY